MRRRTRSNIAVGVLLILLGALFLAQHFIPDLRIFLNFSWPMIVIGVGVFLFILGLLLGAPGMAVPAAIVSGIGGLLYWQNATGNWESWSYAWTLILGFIGIGAILAGLLGEHPRQSLREGLNLIIISVVLFFVFASITGGPNLLGPYWPVLIILLGVWLLARAALFSRKKGV